MILIYILSLSFLGVHDQQVREMVNSSEKLYKMLVVHDAIVKLNIC